MQIIYQTCGILRQLYSHHAEENNYYILTDLRNKAIS